MKYSFAAGAILLLAAMGPGGGAHADSGYKTCNVGDRVADRSGKVGAVISNDSNGTACHVDFDAGPKNDYNLVWMLHSAGKPTLSPAQVSSVAAGKYECFTGPPMHYTFMDVLITGEGRYTDQKGQAGAFSYNASTQAIAFTSGPLKGAHSKYLEGSRIGLASSAAEPFNTVCELKKWP